MSKRDEFIKGPNALRLAQIEQSLQRVKDAGFEREAELLRSEIELLRQKAGTVYDSVEPVFDENVKRRGQPKNAATARHEGLEEYRTCLRKWAVDMYLKDRKESDSLGRSYRSKREGKNNAADWLLKLFKADRKVEKDKNAIPKNAETGNHHGSPEPPSKPKFKATKNFFYKAIQNFS
ncbi:hypothetical protein PSI9734_01778 [Pseudidiomarina piscicola]|uniref:Uncharacterized protein n=1 Tax=Pseudidiomarina piscicola TaxID=2614830 RepID=A0A6S6WPB1_9GAMM|nr:hypothetical protein [Pseudidiomarina piscicola]CAB0151390.1 hypothetical protein PSI9734_01778 [Pseudidiomarina piscicola]VZT40870.1 hypothetical protein PSI9734_01778 [Pseudomonas aeruginosa]